MKGRLVERERGVELVLMVGVTLGPMPRMGYCVVSAKVIFEECVSRAMRMCWRSRSPHPTRKHLKASRWVARKSSKILMSIFNFSL